MNWNTIGHLNLNISLGSVIEATFLHLNEVRSSWFTTWISSNKSQHEECFPFALFLCNYLLYLLLVVEPKTIIKAVNKSTRKKNIGKSIIILIVFFFFPLNWSYDIHITVIWTGSKLHDSTPDYPIICFTKETCKSLGYKACYSILSYFALLYFGKDEELRLHGSNIYMMILKI